MPTHQVLLRVARSEISNVSVVSRCMVILPPGGILIIIVIQSILSGCLRYCMRPCWQPPEPPGIACPRVFCP